MHYRKEHYTSIQLSKQTKNRLEQLGGKSSSKNSSRWMKIMTRSSNFSSKDELCPSCLKELSIHTTSQIVKCALNELHGGVK